MMHVTQMVGIVPLLCYEGWLKDSQRKKYVK